MPTTVIRPPDMSAPSFRPHPTTHPATAQTPKISDFAVVIGDSATMRHSVHVGQKIAISPMRAVLISGEAGTGKELLARCIHNASPNADAPFVPLNCASLPEPLLDVELFGHNGTDGHGRKPGILELTGRGTVFLDEIGELPRALQGKLLRALEEYSVRRYGGVAEVPVQCRVIAATKTRLDDRVAAGTFREDLLGRLSVLKIELPPLRDRGDDVQQIAAHFLADGGRQVNGASKQLGLDAVAALRTHRWPGNIRELRQVLERAIVICDTSMIGAEHLMIQQRRSLAASARAGTGFGEIRIPLTGKRLRDIEREAIELTLQLTNNNQSAASRILCISRPTLARKVRAYGIIA